MAEVPVVIQLGGQKFIRTADMEIITLWRGVSGSASSAQTYGIADYQVPVGKVFLALEFSAVSESSSAIDIRLSNEATVNTADSNNMVIELNSGNFIRGYVPINYTFVANEFIGWIGSSGASHITVTGIEMDA